MTLYRSPDADSAGPEPSYAGLAARLRKLPGYDHPNQQALLDKLASGELDSEECLYQLTQEVITRTRQAQDQARQLQQHDTLQQQEHQQARQQLDAEIARNAGLEEPIVVNAESPPNEGGDAPAETPAAAGSPFSSGSKGTTSPTSTRAQVSYAESGLSGSSGSFASDNAGGFDTPSVVQHRKLDEDDERGVGLEG